MSGKDYKQQAMSAEGNLYQPLVSVVIPTYNRAHDLLRALESVRNQSFTDWEVVLVDNYSTDSTDVIVESLQDIRIRIFKIQNNGIIAASRNLGIEKAQGCYVAFLDSDDWWAPNKLAESVQALEAGADVVYHDAWLVNRADQAEFRRRAKTWPLCEPVADDLIARGNALVNSTVVLRRNLLLQIGGISELPELVAIEDYDTWIRIAELGANFVRLPLVSAYYWIGGGNTSNPSSQLLNTTALAERHRLRFNFARKSPAGCWLDLARGEAMLRLGNFSGAQQNLRFYVFSKAPWRWQAKAILLFFILFLKRLRLMF